MILRHRQPENAGHEDWPGIVGEQVSKRVDWVDTAKGICIIFVVMMHSVLGTEKSTGDLGWMHPIVEFAKPFRMPDFFLISGLFLANVINRDWRLYLDRKVVHFAYFYVLWMTIQMIVKAPIFAEDMGWFGVLEFYALSFVVPLGTLWFIYMLPIFFVVCKLAHDAKVPWQLILGIAALLNIFPIETSWYLLEEFCARFVFFYIGYIFATQIFKLSDLFRDNVLAGLAYLGIWAVINGTLVHMDLAGKPGIGLVLGVAGAGAIIVTSTLLVRAGILNFLTTFGANSIVIYLAFFFPMGVTRQILLKLNLLDTGTMSFIVTTIAVISPMILFWMINRTNIGWFLFRRPQWAYLQGTLPAAKQQAAAE